MARLNRDRGRTLRVRQTNIPDGGVFAVDEQDFIEGAYDPKDYEILGYNDQQLVPRLDEDDRAIPNEDGSPVLMRVYDEIEPKDRDRILRDAAAERKEAAREAKELQRPAPANNGE